MYIKSLELKNYRNYNDLSIEFEKGTNILYGNNAQGKTNVLEAIYVASTTKSHRGSKDREIINFDKDEAHIKITVMKKDVPVRIDIHLKKNKSKGIAINGIPIKKASELFGILNVVFFSPEDYQFSSVAQSCPTLWDPSERQHARPPSPSLTPIVHQTHVD